MSRLTWRQGGMDRQAIDVDHRRLASCCLSAGHFRFTPMNGRRLTPRLVFASAASFVTLHLRGRCQVLGLIVKRARNVRQ